MADTEGQTQSNLEQEPDEQQDSTAESNGETGETDGQTTDETISDLGLGWLGAFLGRWSTLIGQWLLQGLFAPFPMLFFAAVSALQVRPSWKLGARIAFCVLPFILAVGVEALHYTLPCSYRWRLQLVRTIGSIWVAKASKQEALLPAATEDCSSAEDIGITAATTVLQICIWAYFPLRWWLQDDSQRLYALMRTCGIIPPSRPKRKVNNERARQVDSRRSQQAASLLPLTVLRPRDTEEANTTAVEISQNGASPVRSTRKRRNHDDEQQAKLESAHTALCVAIPDPAERCDGSENDAEYHSRLTALLGMYEEVNPGRTALPVDATIQDLHARIQEQQRVVLPTDLGGKYRIPKERFYLKTIRLEQILAQLLQSGPSILNDENFLYCSDEYAAVLKESSRPEKRLKVFGALFAARLVAPPSLMSVYDIACHYTDALRRQGDVSEARAVLTSACGIFWDRREGDVVYASGLFVFLLFTLLQLPRHPDAESELLTLIDRAVSLIVARHRTGSNRYRGQAARLLESVSSLASEGHADQLADWSAELLRVDREEKIAREHSEVKWRQQYGVEAGELRRRRQPDQDAQGDDEDI